jgi:hypothetical protein
MTNLTNLVLLALLSGCAAFTSPTAFNSPALTTHSARVTPLKAYVPDYLSKEQSKWIKAEEQRKYKARTWAHLDSVDSSQIAWKLGKRNTRRERLGIPLLPSVFTKTCHEWSGTVLGTTRASTAPDDLISRSWTRTVPKAVTGRSKVPRFLGPAGRTLVTALRT